MKSIGKSQIEAQNNVTLYSGINCELFLLELDCLFKKSVEYLSFLPLTFIN